MYSGTFISFDQSKVGASRRDRGAANTLRTHPRFSLWPFPLGHIRRAHGSTRRWAQLARTAAIIFEGRRGKFLGSHREGEGEMGWRRDEAGVNPATPKRDLACPSRRFRL